MPFFGTVLDVAWPQANDANPRSLKLKMASNANVEHPLRSGHAASIPSALPYVSRFFTHHFCRFQARDNGFMGWGTPGKAPLRFYKPPIISILITPDTPMGPITPAASRRLTPKCHTLSLSLGPHPLPPPPSLSPPPTPSTCTIHPAIQIQPRSLKLRVVTLAHQCLFSIK